MIGVRLEMFAWLKHRFSALASPSPLLPDPADTRHEALLQLLAAQTELIQKSARTQARLALRVEDVERKLEGGFAEVRQLLKAASAGAAEPSWDELFDAMDFLDEARRLALAAGGHSMADGLGGVLTRLDRLLSARGLVRMSADGVPPDGRLFRVVGTEDRPELPEGTIARVVRAAVLQGDQLLREGEVLTNRKIP